MWDVVRQQNLGCVDGAFTHGKVHSRVNAHQGGPGVDVGGLSQQDLDCVGVVLV